MFLEWLSREGWMLPTWWLLVTLAGMSAFPLAVRLLGGLPDKGYTLSRTLGMLLIAFIYWIMASYGFIDNSTGGMIFAWLIVLVIGLIAYFTGERLNWREYLRENGTVIVIAEILFIVMFATMFVYRAYQNDTFTTEKPMEMNFISGIMRSETFPPNDPWMAGYSISYYHFGYIMTAMLTMLSGLHSGFGFSMMLALIFALTGLTVFGVGYNLSRSRAFEWGTTRRTLSTGKTPAIIAGILATVFVLVMGNFQMSLVEMPYRAQSAPASYFEWWGMQGFTDMGSINYIQNPSTFPVSTPFDSPQTWAGGGWWWWHTSRILTDYNFDGSLAAVQPIDEVPAFSFILMDLHPHVLSLPFLVLAIGMAINLVLLKREPNRYEILLYGLMVGGLLFLNTWDGPLLLVIIAGAEALRRLMRRDGYLSLDDWLALIAFGATLAIIALVAYLPFLISFRSQAGGFIPNLMTPTQFRHYFLMFGPFLLLSGGFLIGEIRQGFQHKRLNFKAGFIGAGSIVGVLLLMMLIFIVIGALFPASRTFVSQFIANNGGSDVVLPEILNRQLETIFLPLFLIAGLIVIVARLFPARYGKTDDEYSTITYTPATGITLLLIAGAFGVTLVPEFVYLRDNFGTRINTIFKFYYQAWIILGLASSYGVYSLLLAPVDSDNRSIISRILYGLTLSFVLLACVPYLPFGMYTRAILEQQRHVLEDEQQAPLTLDGRGDGLSGDYFSAVQCLGNLVQGDDVVVAEASRDTYNSQYGRIGAFYGLPTVINWENHERQWRGATFATVAGSRRADIDRLYSDLRWDAVEPIIEQYDIDYIMYGSTERSQYGDAGEDKFLENLGTVCEFGQAQVYVVRDE